jgi:hypothetical protein
LGNECLFIYKETTALKTALIIPGLWYAYGTHQLAFKACKIIAHEVNIIIFPVAIKTPNFSG